MHIDYNDRTFRSVENSSGGDVGDQTLFHYHQVNRVVWATYQGGVILWGTLIGWCLDDGTLDVRYQHVSVGGELKAGRCRSTPEVLSDGRVRLHESWQWTEGGAGNGRSLVEEIQRSTHSSTPSSVDGNAAHRQ